MNIDTDWCLNCGKQTNGELYCSTQCKNHDENAYKNSGSSSDYSSDNESINSSQSLELNSKCMNNPDKLLYSRLKFKNRLNYDAGFYKPCLFNGLNQWLNQSVKMVSSQGMESPQLGHRYRHHHVGLTNGFKGSYSSSPSESSYGSSPETLIIGSSTSSNNYMNNGFAVNRPYYPWNKNEEDEDISLYEY